MPNNNTYDTGKALLRWNRAHRSGAAKLSGREWITSRNFVPHWC